MLSHLLFTIDSIHDAYSAGVSVHDVIRESLNRIKKTGDEGIYLHLATQQRLDDAIAEVGDLDLKSKPLWGIPFAVKDNIDVAGMPTTAACPDYTYYPKEDAFVVSLLKQAGAIVVGKTNLDQFATGLVGVRTPHPIPKNAVNPNYVPGGSSSGSAVTVSHGQVAFSLGTDTAGSGRVPAALNNIVGLKPSLGSLSNRGVLPACRTLDTISIFALTVEDAQTVFESCSAYDDQEAYSKYFAFKPSPIDIKNIVMGVPSVATRKLDNEIQELAYEKALDFWRQAGAQVVEIDFAPFYDVAKLLYQGPWVAERYSVLSPFIDQHPDALHPVTYSIVSQATKFSAADLFNAQYRLKELNLQITKLLKNVDVICTPSMPGFVTLEQIEKEPVEANSRLGVYTNFVNLLDMCAIAVPGLCQDDGAPSSITLIANSGKDLAIHELAKIYQTEQANRLGAVKQKIKPYQLSLDISETINIAVVGAHMKSLPLNYQLTDRGAKFQFSAKTKPKYRLFHLSEMTPARPGMVQSEQGYSIELEVWALPKPKVGDFLNDVKAPLSIGTIELESGQEIKGFLCESYAIENAQDISHFGGWRNFFVNNQ
ncbi:allophanate hydrolase [Marinomonas transparens]|uniref:Allophanate hydrolase n=1 Tax=Marinomonas transparens TaxID=2795388 RepID=A0A934N0D2_9GAMM|nr:allophanate hydrolase [Marinomonas transparens]MBJ7536602.1 allophanate hydrolase [Marinomonas transparens]